MSNMAIVAPKLSKLIPLLSSDQDGEVIATVRAIGRTLNNAGLDLHDLAKAVATSKAIAVYASGSGPAPDPAAKTLRDIAVWLRAHVNHRMNCKERKFVAEMTTRLTAGARASTKQENWLRSLYYWHGGDYVP